MIAHTLSRVATWNNGKTWPVTYHKKSLAPIGIVPVFPSRSVQSLWFCAEHDSNKHDRARMCRLCDGSLRGLRWYWWQERYFMLLRQPKHRKVSEAGKSIEKNVWHFIYAFRARVVPPWLQIWCVNGGSKWWSCLRKWWNSWRKESQFEKCEGLASPKIKFLCFI